MNGVAVTQRVLKELGSLLVDVNGQQAAQTLKYASSFSNQRKREIALLQPHQSDDVLSASV